MAHFTPYAGSDPLMPEFLHGEARVTAALEQHALAGASTLDVAVGASDAAVDFVPAPGTSLTAAQVDLVRGELRRFLHDQLEPVNLPLPKAVGAMRLKKVVAGGASALT